MIKFCSSFHCFLVFNVMEFDLYIVMFAFGMISLLPLVLWCCSLVFKVNKSQKFSGSFFRSWLYTTGYYYISYSIFDSLYEFSAPSFGPLKFRILIALFCFFNWLEYTYFIFDHILGVNQRVHNILNTERGIWHGILF